MRRKYLKKLSLDDCKIFYLKLAFLIWERDRIEIFFFFQYIPTINDFILKIDGTYNFQIKLSMKTNE